MYLNSDVHSILLILLRMISSTVHLIKCKYCLLNVIHLAFGFDPSPSVLKLLIFSKIRDSKIITSATRTEQLDIYEAYYFPNLSIYRSESFPNPAILAAFTLGS